MSLETLLAELHEGMEWRDKAACRLADPNKFFPTRGASTLEARAICGKCPVQPECLEYTVERRELGVWGGTSERERRTIRREGRE